LDESTAGELNDRGPDSEKEDRSFIEQHIPNSMKMSVWKNTGEDRREPGTANVDGAHSEVHKKDVSDLRIYTF